MRERVSGVPAWLLAVVPAAVVFVVHVALLRPAYVDDQYIFYRYAHNWAHGLGPVFNVGELVEGFSSTIWLLVLTAGEVLGVRADAAGPIVSAALGLACLALLAWVARGLLPDVGPAPFLLPLALALITGFAFYSASGMDAIVFAFTLLLSVVVLSGYARRARSGRPSRAWAVAAVACLAALALVRAEGFFYALALSLAVFLAVPRRSVPGWRALLPLPLAAGAATAAVFVARQAIFGEWQPATVMAKGYVTHYALDALRGNPASGGPLRYGLEQGLDYVGIPLGLLLAAIALTLVMEVARRRRPPPFVVLGAVAIGLNAAIMVWSTGDWMPHDRLLVPILPLLVAVSAWCAVTLARRTPLWRSLAGRSAGVAIAVAAVVLVVGADVSALSAPPPRLYYDSADIGNALARSPRRATLVTHFAGKMAYQAGSRTYVRDIFGLTDIHNAKYGDWWVPRFGRTDFAYSFRRFDVLVTPVKEDLSRLRRISQRRGEPAGQYVLLRGRKWPVMGLYLVVRRDSSVRPSLEALCRCRGVRLRSAD